MSKFNTLTQREVINPNTGEITVIESCKSFTTKVEDDKFYMTFIGFMAPFYNLKSENAQKLLVWLCEHAEFNTGKAMLTTNSRKKICEELNISNNTITNNLKKLKDAKLITGKNGEFVINPKIFWKGETSARKQLLKDKNIQITFGIEN